MNKYQAGRPCPTWWLAPPDLTDHRLDLKNTGGPPVPHLCGGLGDGEDVGEGEVG